jgi:hypothetical protein
VAPAILQIKAVFLLDVVDEFVGALKSVDHDFSELVEQASQRARATLAGKVDS